MKSKKLFRRSRRLVIRPLELKDYEAWVVANLKMAKSQNKWDLGPKPPHDLTKLNFKKILKKFSEQQKKDFYYNCHVFLKTGELIGMVSLMEVARGITQTAFFGYRIYNPYWGKGYAKEACRLMIDIGFKDLKLHRIEAGIEPGNVRSIALAKSLKMRHEGLKKRAIYLRGKWVDLIMYTVTTEDLGYKYKF